jgi:hypothetical protein
MSNQPTEDQVLPGLFLKLMLVFLAILLLRSVLSRAAGRRKESLEEQSESGES